MKRVVKNWTIEKLSKERTRLLFPDYQREPHLWPTEKKALLIDSILTNIDIPKLYFNHVDAQNYEVVDGQQRLWALWDFLDDKFSYAGGSEKTCFSRLSKMERTRILKYKLQITILEDASDEYLRTLFLRLQLGLLLVTGEKLKASTGELKDFLFGAMSATSFVKSIGIPSRRFARETLCAQIAINSFSRDTLKAFARTRYDDLLHFCDTYAHPQGKDLEVFKRVTSRILQTLGEASEVFGQDATKLRNRSFILSAYLLIEDRLGTSAFKRDDRKRFHDFALLLWRRLREEAKLGIKRKNEALYSFQSLLSSAPGERYQIERRHEKLGEFYDHYCNRGGIKGEK